MIHRALSAFVILACAALIPGSSAMQAASVKSEKFSIPFEFQVQKEILPAGEYRILQADGSNVAVLVNTRTGESVQILRASPTHEEGKARLVFEDGESRHFLKRIY